MSAPASKLPILTFETAAALDDWLSAQADDAPGIWLKIAKGASERISVTKAEAIELALRHGWIDGQLDRFDEDWFLVRYTPRSPRSKWSAINKAAAEKLIAAGRMTPRGLAQVEAARSDGRWEAAYAPQSKAVVPEDLAAALEAQPKAKALFDALDSANRYAVLYRVQAPKKPETRARKIESLVAMLARGDTIHPLRRKATRS